MKALQDAGVTDEFCVVAVRGIELFPILVPSGKHLGRSSESDLQGHFFSNINLDVGQLLHKLRTI